MPITLERILLLLSNINDDEFMINSVNYTRLELFEKHGKKMLLLLTIHAFGNSRTYIELVVNGPTRIEFTLNGGSEFLIELVKEFDAEKMSLILEYKRNSKVGEFTFGNLLHGASGKPQSEDESNESGDDSDEDEFYGQIIKKFTVCTRNGDARVDVTLDYSPEYSYSMPCATDFLIVLINMFKTLNLNVKISY